MLWAADVTEKLQCTQARYAMHEADMQRQFAAMHGTLWERPPSTILDIGSGLAVIDIMICKSFPVKVVHLLDGDGSGPHRAGFAPAGVPWGNVHMGASMVRANCPGVDVFPHVVPKCEIVGLVDLILSTRSWGHHYPVPTYSELAARLLSRGGVVIMDIRYATDGVHEMRHAGFRPIVQIDDPSEKCRRIAFERVPA